MKFCIKVQAVYDCDDKVYDVDKITQVRWLVAHIQEKQPDAEFITVEQGKWTIARFARTRSGAEKGKWQGPSVIRAN
jgi:hypothetical protein